MVRSQLRLASLHHFHLQLFGLLPSALIPVLVSVRQPGFFATYWEAMVMNLGAGWNVNVPSLKALVHIAKGRSRCHKDGISRYAVDRQQEVGLNLRILRSFRIFSAAVLSSKASDGDDRAGPCRSAIAALLNLVTSSLGGNT